MKIRSNNFLLWVGIAIAGASVFSLGSLINGHKFPSIAQAPGDLPEILERMTLDRIDDILREETDNVRTNGSQWQFEIGGRAMLLVADERANRMRLIAPIVETQGLGAEEYLSMMLANYHTSLDARYALTREGAIVAVFLHPLASLQASDLRSALSQVAQLAETFGSTYNSGAILFDLPGAVEEQPIPEGFDI